MTDLVVVEEIEVLTVEGSEDVVLEQVEVTEIITDAEQGPPGPAGGGNYEHPQTIAAAVWTVPHNLGRHPSVSVTDHLGNLVIADTQYIDTNIVQITHGTAMTGWAYCN